MADEPGLHSINRVFEWVSAGSVLGAGIDQAFYPSAFVVSKFQYALDRIGADSIGMFCVIIGGVRCIALFYNGRLGIVGVGARILTAIGSAMIWFQMGYSLYLTQSAIHGPPSPSLLHYILLVCGELYSAFRAGTDARFR